MPRPPTMTTALIDHELPRWPYVVTMTIAGLGTPAAVCKSPGRADLVAEALQLLADKDPAAFERRVREIVAADRALGDY